jgi:hypothetical protein
MYTTFCDHCLLIIFVSILNEYINIIITVKIQSKHGHVLQTLGFARAKSPPTLSSTMDTALDAVFNFPSLMA